VRYRAVAPARGHEKTWRRASNRRLDHGRRGLYRIPTRHEPYYLCPTRLARTKKHGCPSALAPHHNANRVCALHQPATSSVDATVNRVRPLADNTNPTSAALAMGGVDSPHIQVCTRRAATRRQPTRRRQAADPQRGGQSSTECAPPPPARTIHPRHSSAGPFSVPCCQRVADGAPPALRARAGDRPRATGVEA